MPVQVATRRSRHGERVCGAQHYCLVSLPTGTGKTLVFCELIRRRGGRALVIAHRDKLLAQAQTKLVAAGIGSGAIGWVKAGRDEVSSPLVLASMQTLARKSRRERLIAAQAEGGMFTTIVIDEAHHVPATSYLDFLDAMEEAIGPDDEGPLVLGVTATPARGGRRRRPSSSSGRSQGRERPTRLSLADASNNQKGTRLPASTHHRPATRPAGGAVCDLLAIVTAGRPTTAGHNIVASNAGTRLVAFSDAVRDDDASATSGHLMSRNGPAPSRYWFLQPRTSRAPLLIRGGIFFFGGSPAGKKSRRNPIPHGLTLGL